MEETQTGNIPSQCPVCAGELAVTKLQCTNCGTEVNGTFTLGRLAALREPHASLLEMFLRVRGNVKEMERELGLSYPTVRARLEEALQAAGFPRETSRGPEGEGGWEVRLESDLTERIRAVVDEKLSGLGQMSRRNEREFERRTRRDDAAAVERREVIDLLERGELDAAEAAELLRDLKKAR
jgi:hypothetical protein